MYPVSFDTPDRAPLDFNADSVNSAIADAPVHTAAAVADVPAPDAHVLLEQIGVPAHRVRQVLAESLAPDL